MIAAFPWLSGEDRGQCIRSRNRDSGSDFSCGACAAAAPLFSSPRLQWCPFSRTGCCHISIAGGSVAVAESSLSSAAGLANAPVCHLRVLRSFVFFCLAKFPGGMVQSGTMRPADHVGRAMRRGYRDMTAGRRPGGRNRGAVAARGSRSGVARPLVGPGFTRSLFFGGCAVFRRAPAAGSSPAGNGLK